MDELTAKDLMISTAENIWWERVNSYPFKFFGIMILPNEGIHDLED